MTTAMLSVLISPRGDPRSRGQRLVRVGLLCLGLLFAVGASAPQQGTARIGRSGKSTITSFEAPGAGKGMRQGTVPTSINSAGAIAGFDLDANGLGHGFAR